jgi:hypothetical protein
VVNPLINPRPAGTTRSRASGPMKPNVAENYLQGIADRAMQPGQRCEDNKGARDRSAMSNDR